MMMATDQLWSDDFWNIWETLLVKDSVDVVSAFCRAIFWSDVFGLGVIGLQFGYPKPNSTNANLVGPLVG